MYDRQENIDRTNKLKREEEKKSKAKRSLNPEDTDRYDSFYKLCVLISNLIFDRSLKRNLIKQTFMFTIACFINGGKYTSKNWPMGLPITCAIYEKTYHENEKIS